MHAFFGLGNPGSEYDGTRHNVGFSIVDALCEELGVELRAGEGEYLIGTASYRGTRCCLVKPLTYMNNSGVAVQDVVVRQKIRLDEVLVMCDDFQLPLGKLRLRGSGSDGGHNGLYSVIYHMQTDKFPRLRCGIAGPPESFGPASGEGLRSAGGRRRAAESMPPRKSAMAQFVLTVFTRDEQHVVKQMVSRARDAALTFAGEGLTAAMNRFNS